MSRKIHLVLDREMNRYYLGNLLKLSEEKNYNSQYGIDSVKGVSIQKSFIETKADMTGSKVNNRYRPKACQNDSLWSFYRNFAHF